MKAVWQANQNQDGAARTGYTMADIEAMRAQPNDWRPSSYRGGTSRYLIRFWTRNLDGGLVMLEGQIGVWHRQLDVLHRTTITFELCGPIRELTMDPDEIFEIAADAGRLGPLPVGTVPDGMVAIESGLPDPDAFAPIGYVDLSDFEVEHNSDIVHTWGGNTMAVFQRYKVIVRLAADDQLLEMLRRVQ